MLPARLAFPLGLLALAACRTTQPGGALPAPAIVPEAFVTAGAAPGELDSPAVWLGPGGRHWVVVTAKSGDRLAVYDAATGAPVREVENAFARPNGVAVADDLVFVVERDAARVQVLRLPDFTPLGAFGHDVLERPYGLTVLPQGDGRYGLFVTDNYTGLFGAPAAQRTLGRRVHRFTVTVEADTLAAQHGGAFGETTGPGVLHKVESIVADPAHGHLLIAEEQEGASTVRVYGLDGRYAGRDLPHALFPHEAEGVALAACPDGAGYVVATDQGPARSTFHVFDRATLAYLGSFAGPATANTDGVALTLAPFGPFLRGAFFAVDDDTAVAAFDWGAVLDALHLPGCGG